MHSRVALKGGVVEVKRSEAATISRTTSFPGMSRFYLDVLDGDRVITDPEGIDFAGSAKQPSPKPSKAQGACFARDHEQRTRVRAALPHPGWNWRDGRDRGIRDTLPGRLKGEFPVAFP